MTADIAVCESCERGYVPAPICAWCGAGGWLSYVEPRVERTIDTECYPNYWLCKVDPPFEGRSDWQLTPDHPLDRDSLLTMLSRTQLVSFNGRSYDLPMIALALTGANNALLKQASDWIIKGGIQPWNFYRHFNIEEPTWIDHIDMIEVAPGQTSLKEYGGKMHAPKIQDLPIEPDQPINCWFERLQLREYCGNDLHTTWLLRKQFDAEIKLREQMSEEFGIDLRSKSDAQIAEAIMKKLLGGYVEKTYVAPGTQFIYEPARWIKFQQLNVLDLIARSPFTVTDSGGLEMTNELKNTKIRIGRTTYQMGIGGLHSTESKAVHVADAEYSLQDVDVASYYPSLIRATGILPPAIGAPFQEIYCGWITRRLSAKRAGDKKTANSLKTLLNGTFGKLGSKWSIFYSPTGFIQVTIGGQLSLLMLIEMLEINGIGVVSANTDGIVIKCRRDMEWLRDQIIAWWCAETSFETEYKNYLFLASRDINSYVALDVDGNIKLKGAYARPVPVATSWPNPSGEICIDAVVEFLSKGVPLDRTIRACVDVKKFVHIRRVKGGALWNGQFLGKVARWIYSTSSEAAEIVYRSNGNRVPDSDGARPLMELPESLPTDIDYDRYLSDARTMCHDLGAKA